MGVLSKLTDVRCRTAGLGTYGDGGGLLLQVRQGANSLVRSWVYRYSIGGKQHWVGLGSYPMVTLARAREKATDARRQRSDGVDPLAFKQAHQRASLRQQYAPIPTFDEATRAYHNAHSAGWRNRKYAVQWLQTLVEYASPVIGSMPVDQIDMPAVLNVLKPLWSSKPATASRLRGKIEVVLDAARVHGYRSGENPARWRGHLDKLLPRPSRLRVVKHHRSLPYPAIVSFMTALRDRGGTAPLALQFVILTAARAGEVTGMTWSEIDFESNQWTVPPSRMKARKSHRVPLSDQALAVLKKMRAVQHRSGDERVFPVTPAALDMVLRRTQVDACTHGFRATFRMWAAECTSYPREVIEQCLAHATGSAVELAYQRSDVLEKRRQLMAQWADYCDRTGAEVIPLRNVS